jgi:hypothetical protein
VLDLLVYLVKGNPKVASMMTGTFQATHHPAITGQDEIGKHALLFTFAFEN